jgi:hypothetical protein
MTLSRTRNALLCLLVIGFAPIVAGGCADRAVGSVAWRSSVRDLAAKSFKNPAWGYSHSVRDYELAKVLAAEDHVAIDDDVLYAAAFLHDMAAFAPWEKAGEDHADEAARVVEKVLQGTDFPMAKIDAVRDAIRTHMYDRQPVEAAAFYLHDADALDWLGAIGVARVMALVDPNGGGPNGPKMVEMLRENLATVPARVLTSAGQRRMPALRAELEKFLVDLERETDGLRSL